MSTKKKAKQTEKTTSVRQAMDDLFGYGAVEMIEGMVLFCGGWACIAIGIRNLAKWPPLLVPRELGVVATIAICLVAVLLGLGLLGLSFRVMTSPRR